MKKFLIISFVSFLSVQLFSQTAIQVGAGSYGSHVPSSVYEEGAYFGKTYEELSSKWPWYIHSTKVDEPIPTNKWWSALIFDQYTGRLEAYPQRVEGLPSGIRVSAYTDFRMTDDRGLTAYADNWIEVKGDVASGGASSSVVFADFESETYPAGWTVTPNAPHPGPVSLADLSQAPEPNGFLGSRFVNTFNGDAPQATISSPTFTVEKDYIHMLVGGGNNIDQTYVGLFVNGNRVEAVTGENSGTLTWKRIDARSYKGQQAQIRIVDESSGGWGFIMCDNIVFSDDTEPNSSFSNSFWPQDAKVYDWSDLSVTFRLEDDKGNLMDGTVVHGVPYTYIDINGIDPVIGSSANVTRYFNGQGNQVSSFPVTTNTLVLEVGGSFFGVHAPNGTKFDKNQGGEVTVEFPSSGKKYLTVSWIPTQNLIATYDANSRNKIVKSKFEWDYQIEDGKIVTSFVFDTENYETGTKNQPTIFSMLPHHHRNTVTPSLISGAEYTTLRGVMKSTSQRKIDIEYKFGGMPPFLPEPLNLDAAQKQRLDDLISIKVEHSNNYRNGNTYAKGFGEQSSIMLMAKQMDHPGYGTIRDNMKNELIDWLTFDPSEASAGQYFFTRYPEFGALIGFPSGYGSQAFNDLHFHYGYFIMGAARLMLVDEEFKTQYGDMVKMIAKSYANWVRDEKKNEGGQPFLRTFDPYMGNSWAGGIGSSYDGNNQESTSEATHSWFAIYMLGVAMEDHEIMSLGATGFMLEGMTAANYWFNRYGDLPSAYNFNYVGINRPNNIAMATYFHGDPAWAFGIQFVPCDFYYNFYWGDNEQMAKDVFDEMLEDRIHFSEGTNTDYYSNIAEMGDYLGGYYVNYIQLFDADLASSLLDDLYTNESQEWRSSTNTATNYYNINATVSYGKPADGYHTSLPTGAVYEKPNGDVVYLLYNHSSQSKDVKIYKNGAVIETITVGPGQYYNSMDSNQKPVANAGVDRSIQSPQNSITLDGSSSYDPDGSLVQYQWEQISGNAVILQSPNTSVTNVTNMKHGVYIFKLTVTDNEGKTATDQVRITVKPSASEINIALKKPAWASSIQEPWKVEDVNDGNVGSRWGSEVGIDPQWVAIDLEEDYKIVGVKLNWEGAFGKVYEIQLSNDENFSNYTTLVSENNGQGGIEEFEINNEEYGRYIRMYGTERGTPHGYSLFEFEVYGLSLSTKIENKTDQKLEIYPNPAQEIVNVSWDKDKYTVEIFTLSGSRIDLQTVNNVTAQLNIGELTNGVYLLKVTSNEITEIRKIVVNR